MIGRLGGDEFAVLLEASPSAATEIARYLCAAIAKIQIETPDGAVTLDALARSRASAVVVGSRPRTHFTPITSIDRESIVKWPAVLLLSMPHRSRASTFSV
jgi:GGDEF domain-containing protein